MRAMRCLFFCLCVWMLLPAANLFAASVCHLQGCMDVEVVSDSLDMARGLMGREGLGKDKGMLFLFSHNAKHHMWMKNMKFAIDVIWLSKEGAIISFLEQVPPCKEDPCPVYIPDGESRYVLEVSAGYAKAHGWKNGTRLMLKGLEAKK